MVLRDELARDLGESGPSWPTPSQLPPAHDQARRSAGGRSSQARICATFFDSGTFASNGVTRNVAARPRHSDSEPPRRTRRRARSGARRRSRAARPRSSSRCCRSELLPLASRKVFSMIPWRSDRCRWRATRGWERARREHRGESLRARAVALHARERGRRPARDSRAASHPRRAGSRPGARPPRALAPKLQIPTSASTRARQPVRESRPHRSGTQGLARAAARARCVERASTEWNARHLEKVIRFTRCARTSPSRRAATRQAASRARARASVSGAGPKIQARKLNVQGVGWRGQIGSKEIWL